jgi:hypothetical protein
VTQTKREEKSSLKDDKNVKNFTKDEVLRIESEK